MRKDEFILLRNGLPATPVSNVRMKEGERQRIAADVAAFIAAGGTINQVDHTANRCAPVMGYNNQVIAHRQQKHEQTARERKRQRMNAGKIKFGAAACTRKNAS